MSERVTMPALGESVTEGTVTRWLKNVGDRIEVDEPLLEVSTDKVDTEIPSPVAGTLQEILAQEDDTVPVGADLAVIGDGERARPPVATPPAAEAPRRSPRRPRSRRQPRRPRHRAPSRSRQAARASPRPRRPSSRRRPASSVRGGRRGPDVTMPASASRSPRAPSRAG